MSHRTFLSVVIICAAIVLAAHPSVAQTTWFAATLSGDRPRGAGDADGWGLAAIGVGDDTVWYWVWVTDAAAPTASHIHMGYAGTSGGIAVDFEAAFTEVASGTNVASGSVAVDAATRDDLLERPAGFYVNVHNADFPSGAVRGQLLGDGPSLAALAGTMRGFRQVGNAGDPDGEGFGAVVFDGGTAHYYLAVENIADPTAAHIHRGAANEAGSVVVGFDPQFTSGAAQGSVAADDSTIAQILASPENFYFNVHNADFQAGAIRGQLRATETTVSYPVISLATGQAGTNWSTWLRVLNPGDEDVTVHAEWYPNNDNGLDEPDQMATIGVVDGGTAVVDDVVATLFSGDGNGGMRLMSTEPFVSTSRVFNDQRDNPEIGGTFGQHVPSSAGSGMPAAGALLLPSNRPASDGTGWRTNLGWFNPYPSDVEVTFNAWTVGGALLGTRTITIKGFANNIRNVFSVINTVPSGQRTQDDLTVTYAAAAPILIFASVVDNVTGDGIHVFPLPVPWALTVLSNSSPNGTITSPTGDETITEGSSVSFAGAAEDPDGDDMTYLWDFGDGTTSTELSPGAHTYAAIGVHTVTFTVTDSRGASDSSPATRAITVDAGQENGPPNGTITSPAGNSTITEGGSVSFAGTAEDPDGDDMTYLWDFGDGMTSIQLSPGAHTYTAAGEYTVTFTATDSNDASDPSPDTRTITVNEVQLQDPTYAAVQEQILTPSCARSGCHGNGAMNAGLALDAGVAYGNLVDVASSEQPSLDRIEPGDPDNSYLWRKVNGGPDIDGVRMPRNRPQLSQAMLDLLEAWILDGAPEN